MPLPLSAQSVTRIVDHPDVLISTGLIVGIAIGALLLLLLLIGECLRCDHLPMRTFRLKYVKAWNQSKIQVCSFEHFCQNQSINQSIWNSIVAFWTFMPKSINQSIDLKFKFCHLDVYAEINQSIDQSEIQTLSFGRLCRSEFFLKKVFNFVLEK